MSRPPNEPDSSRPTYESRGASPHKPDVRRAIQELDPGLFPGAFCKAIPDVFTGSPEHCVLLHADGAGTKSALAYIHYRRHGNPRVFVSIAQDSIVMNLDDLVCVGATGPFVLSNTIGRNAKLIAGEVVSAIIAGYEEFAARVRRYAIEIYTCGGETADLGDLVRTVVVDSVLATRMRRDDVVDCSHISAGLDIVGFASSGQASYEDQHNSGIGTNGFTTARHELLSARYKAEFPETFAPDIAELAYTGRFDIDDLLPGSDMSVGDALLSPTRTYAPVLVPILERHRSDISGMFHNSGGGQTKCLPFGRGIRYVKDSLFELPPIFEFIREQTRMSLREMFRIFNMGHRLEVVCRRSASADIIGIAADYGVEARVIGRTEHSKNGNSVVIEALGQTLDYSLE